MKRSDISKMAKAHSLNAVNRVEFANRIRFDDPIKRLSAAVILQAALDKLKYEKETSFWYRGNRVYIQNAMDEEDYRFYADIAGINYSWSEFLEIVTRNFNRTNKKRCTDAAELMDILE